MCSESQTKKSLYQFHLLGGLSHTFNDFDLLSIFIKSESQIKNQSSQFSPTFILILSTLLHQRSDLFLSYQERMAQTRFSKCFPSL